MSSSSSSEDPTSKKSDTQTTTLFSSGSSSSFCCTSWSIKLHTLPGTKSHNDANNALSLKLLAFINAGKTTTVSPMPMYNRDRVENAKWLVKFNRRTTNPQMQVWMAAKDDEVGMEEFCRGSECFQKGFGREVEDEGV